MEEDLNSPKSSFKPKTIFNTGSSFGTFEKKIKDADPNEAEKMKTVRHSRTGLWTTKSLQEALMEARKEIIHLQTQCEDLTSQNEKLKEQMTTRMDSYMRREGKYKQEINHLEGKLKDRLDDTDVMEKVREMTHRVQENFQKLYSEKHDLEKEHNKMVKAKLEYKRAEIMAKEKKEQEAAEWDKRLTTIGSQLNTLRDQAQTLERSNTSLTLENKKLKKQAQYEPEVTFLYMESKKDMKALQKENEELKQELAALKESLPAKSLKSKSEEFLADVRATIAQSREMVRDSQLNSPKHSKPNSNNVSPMNSTRRSGTRSSSIGADVYKEEVRRLQESLKVEKQNVKKLKSLLARKKELESLYVKCLQELSLEHQNQVLITSVDAYTEEDLIRALQILISHANHLKLSPYITDTNFEDTDVTVDQIVARLLEEENLIKQMSTWSSVFIYKFYLQISIVATKANCVLRNFEAFECLIDFRLEQLWGYNK